MAAEIPVGGSALEQRKRELEALQALYARWARGDFTAAEFFADDVVWVPQGIDVDGEFHGVRAMAEQWRDYLTAWSQFQIKAVEVIPASAGQYVVVQIFRGKGKSSGAVTEGRTAVVITMRDDKIARMEGYWERDDAFRAAGIERQ
jgi:ketosteroid isomerase-like protein